MVLSDIINSGYCSGTTCAAKLANSVACSSDSSCSSGIVSSNTQCALPPHTYIFLLHRSLFLCLIYIFASPHHLTPRDDVVGCVVLCCVVLCCVVCVFQNLIIPI
jgi:hypothetical protein